MKKICTVLTICLFFCGCASVAYRADSSSIPEISPGIYPGVRAGINFMKDSAKGDIESSHSIVDPIIFLAFIPDVPLSFLIDTICLPYDIFQIGKGTKEIEEEKTDILIED